MIAGKYTGIYESILDWCGQLEWPEPWSCLGSSGGALIGVQDANALCDDLLAKYSAESLVEAGALSPTDDGGEVISVSLAESLLVPIVCSRSGCCLDILTQSGCLSGRSHALSMVEWDIHTVEHIESSERRVFLAADLVDVALLRALGLPATLTAGLSELHPDAVRNLSRFGFAPSTGNPASERPSDQPASPLTPLLSLALRLQQDVLAHRTPRYRPTLVAWSLCDRLREPPAEVGPVIDRLSTLSRVMRLDLSRIDVWCPTERELETLEDALSLGDSQCVRDLVLQSARNSSMGLPKAAGLVVEASTKERYIGAVRRLRDAREKGSESEICRSADELRQLTHQCLIEPLIENAHGITSPRERLKRMALAELAGHFFDSSERAARRSATDADHRRGGENQDLLNAISLAKQMREMLE